MQTWGFLLVGKMAHVVTVYLSCSPPGGAAGGATQLLHSQHPVPQGQW